MDGCLQPAQSVNSTSVHWCRAWTPLPELSKPGAQGPRSNRVFWPTKWPWQWPISPWEDRPPSWASPLKDWVSTPCEARHQIIFQAEIYVSFLFLHECLNCFTKRCLFITVLPYMSYQYRRLCHHTAFIFMVMPRTAFRTALRCNVGPNSLSGAHEKHPRKGGGGRKRIKQMRTTTRAKQHTRCLEPKGTESWWGSMCQEEMLGRSKQLVSWWSNLWLSGGIDLLAAGAGFNIRIMTFANKMEPQHSSFFFVCTGDSQYQRAVYNESFNVPLQPSRAFSHRPTSY